jgi:uncharacterized membrane protein
MITAPMRRKTPRADIFRMNALPRKGKNITISINLLPGTEAFSMLEFLHPVHPKLVHFPVALFITALGLEILSWIAKKEIFHQCAVLMFIIAALATPVVVRTGLWEEEELRLGHPLLGQHQTFALWTMWTTLMSLPVLWYLRQNALRAFRIFFIVCLVCASVLVTLTADKGGKMVYEHGIGIEE